MDEIIFSAKYKNWISIKKMSIDEKTTPQEVIGILASIDETISKKAFEFSGIELKKIDEFVQKITKNRRKGYASLGEVFINLKPSEVREVLLEVGGEEKLAIAEAYFIRKLIETIGFNISITQELLSKIYPELKLPKPKGRMKK